MIVCKHDGCEKTFSKSRALSKHVYKCHTFAFVCGNCTNTFHDRYAFERHQRTQHNGEHKLQCPTCGKRYDDQQRLDRHVAAHARTTMETITPPPTFWTEMMEESLAELHQLRRQSAKCSPGKCIVAVRDREKKSFVCNTCQAQVHYACVGYNKELLSILPIILCPTCTNEFACDRAAINRRLLLAHAETIGHRVMSIKADGWCLVRCIAIAIERDYEEVFLEAVGLLACSLDTAPDLSEEDRKELRAVCATILRRPV